MSVWHTSTDPDRKRLLKALAVTVVLHGSLLCALLVTLPEQIHSPKPPRFFQLTLLDGGGGPQAPAKSGSLRPAKAMPLLQSETPPNSGSLHTAEEPKVTDMAGLAGLDGETVSGRETEAGVSGAGSGIGGGNGMASGGATVIGTDAFLSWLDGQIKNKLLYPERARRRNLEGTVVLGLTVSADGASCVPVVLGGSGSALLDKAAVDLVLSLFPSPVAPGRKFVDSIRIQYLMNQH